jgi:tetratricopeptide (TPR) repeat protein
VKNLVAGALLLLIPVCAYQTWKRCDVWQNSESLWNDTIQKYPHRIADAYFLRGSYYHHSIGRPDAALADYNEALTLSPKAAFIWANKGTLLSDLNSPDSAYACINRAIALKPDLAFALNNRGAIKGQRGDLPGAIADFARAIASDPQFRDPYENRAVAYYMLHEYEKAIADSRRAIEIDPANPNNHGLLDAIGLSLQALHRYREAVAEHDAAIRGAPYGDPRIAGYYLNRSLAWLGWGDRGRALRDAQEARLLGATVQEAYLRDLEVAGSTTGTP